MNLTFNDLPVAVLLFAGLVISILSRKLTPAAALIGCAAGWVIFKGGGYAGLFMLIAFFMMGTLATSWKINEKRLPGTGGNSTKRNTGQVLANAGVAALAGLSACFLPQYDAILQLILASSLASAAADTLSSELGMVYGRRFYHILSWKTDLKGLDGVVSIEGTLIGIAGSVLISLLDAAAHGLSKRFIYIVIAGTIGNLTDSVLGAALERKKYLTNDMVNFLNTLAAALAAGCMAGWFS